MPILLVLVFGLLQYGLYFWAAQGGSNAAREAARRAAVGEYPVCADFTGYVTDRIDSLGDTDAAVITRTYSNGPAPNVAANLEPGDVVTVEVTFNAPDLNIPLIPYPDNGQVTSCRRPRPTPTRSTPRWPPTSTRPRTSSWGNRARS